MQVFLLFYFQLVRSQLLSEAVISPLVLAHILFHYYYSRITQFFLYEIPILLCVDNALQLCVISKFHMQTPIFSPPENINKIILKTDQ